jgi:hypothetical protein
VPKAAEGACSEHGRRPSWSTRSSPVGCVASLAIAAGWAFVSIGLSSGVAK